MLNWLRSRTLVICIVLSGAVFLIDYDEEDVYRAVREPAFGWIQAIYPQAAEEIETWYADGRKWFRGESQSDLPGELQREAPGERNQSALGADPGESVKASEGRS